MLALRYCMNMAQTSVLETRKGSMVARKTNVGEGARRRLAQHEQDVAAEVAAAVSEADQVKQDSGVLVQLPVGAIAPDPGNPRKDVSQLDGLVTSIEQYGVLQPVTVRPADAGEQLPEGVRYVLVMGERRHTAATRAGLETIPAVVRSTVVEDRLPVQLLENLQRQALSPVEEAVAYQSLAEQGLSQREISRRLGVSQPHVHRRLALLGMAPAALDLVVSGRLPVDVAANEVAKLDPELQRRWVAEVTAEAAAEAAAVQDAEVGVISPAEAREAIARVLRQKEREDLVEAQRDWAEERGLEIVERKDAFNGHDDWRYRGEDDHGAPDDAEGRLVAVLDPWDRTGVPDVYEVVPRRSPGPDSEERAQRRQAEQKEAARREKELRRVVDQMIGAGDIPSKPQMLTMVVRWMMRRAYAIDVKRVRKALGKKVAVNVEDWKWSDKISNADALVMAAGLLVLSDSERAGSDAEANRRTRARMNELEDGLADRLLGEETD